MTDLNKEREAFEAWIDSEFSEDDWYCEAASQNHLHDFYESTQAYYCGIENDMWMAWLGAKAQAVPTWILASTTLPEEGEDVLFLDTHNIIHEGFLNTDYADGPYGENGEDLGGNLTLWTSNSNGEEFLLEEVKFWMVRPSNPKIGESGAANE
ncbi:hypothetical protein NQ997_14475 [Acinetobacter baumannii]|nr:hypothetical protein [Acinetobacter baumannii]MDC4897503.1 hypothetical protein [Acinetobacter baumannii]MDC4901019.1 hypothetical protein [Acinetobacter baumannii]MDC4907533.1 hypothetical protein [Acinetobacter baumannii]MDC4914067.1 hypothetical protein [Acinetobacter baumannii]